MIKKILSIICYFRGCRYPGPLVRFDNYSLVHCLCCGRELCDRTIDDILPVPDDHDWWDEEQ